MIGRILAVVAALWLAGCSAGPAGPAAGADVVECAPFARALTGLDLHGDAASWWEQAAGRYARGDRPAAGAVLVFRRSPRLPAGHVGVVTGLVSAREIRVTHANWVHHRIGRDDPVIDVSPANDWSAVQVWWAPAAALGATEYRTYGFVGP